MPASLNAKPSEAAQQQCDKGLCRNPSAQCIAKSSKSLNIGLINNMPDGALEATERQFLSLLNSASDGMSIRLSLYSLPDVPRNEMGERHVRRFYSSTESLRDRQLDGLIVTGREPLTSNLADEPYWESFTRILEWASENTRSTIWSCLAAHAATLHMDGIHRIKSSHKHCGVFDCTRLSDHPLTAGTPARFKLPHSRWNGIPEDQLNACGYRVLTRAADAGVDMFIKQQKSLFVFFQGHPEYESSTLLLEYRRDVSRYLRGETDTYPSIPRGYFDDDTMIRLTAIQQEAKANPRDDIRAELGGILEKLCIENTWHQTATYVYRNWLQYICTQKELELRGRLASEVLNIGSSILSPAAASSVPASTVIPVGAQRSSTTSVPPLMTAL
jgi:homoserine O-succinyltransferase